MTNSFSSLPQGALRITSIGVLIVLAGSAGCSKSDNAKAAVKEAGRNFTSIAVGDPTASQPFTEQTYRETDSLLEEFKGDENGYAEAAAISLSLSKLGQASLASMKASDAETEALHQTRVIRGMINEWLTLSAIAQAAGQFDPSAELSEIEKIIKLRQDDIEHYQAQQAQIGTEIGAYEDQIADLRSKASVQRNESGALELQMPRVSATEAAEIVQRVREHTLRADQYELEAVRIEGIVGQLRPGAREIGLNVGMATSQIELLVKAREELNERAVSSRNDAQLASDGASAAAAQIKEAVDVFAQFRENEVLSANDAAISLTRTAISTLRDAKKATRQIASLTKSSAQQTLGECYARQAGGYREAAILYHALDETGLAGDWSAREQNALDAQSEAKTAANQAFQNAASSLRSARIRGPEGEKLEATAKRLDLLAGIAPEPEFEESFDDGLQDLGTPETTDDESGDQSPPADDGG
jgi:hypothetical protein